VPPQTTKPFTAYAPLADQEDPASTRPEDSDPSWLGVALTLAAAAAAFYAGRRLRPANVTTNRAATAA
jgi:hypothetical protein